MEIRQFIVLIILMSCTSCIGIQKDSLLNKATKECLNSMNNDLQDNLFLHLEFWQTWSNMEFAALAVQSPKIDSALKSEVQSKVHGMWTRFNLSKKGTPSCYLDKAWVANKKYWDPQNENILWDDRLWLGNSYLQLYAQFKVQGYLDVALKLYEFIVTENDDPFSKDYIGLRWKRKEHYRNTVTNGLFMVFAGRLYGITLDKKYLEILKKQYELLFRTEGKYVLVRDQSGTRRFLLPDYSQPSVYLTYNQAMPLEGLAHLILYDSSVDPSVYMKDLCSLINETISYFRFPGMEKYICNEIGGKDETDKTNCGLFRSYLFRHLIWMKRQLSVKKNFWEQLLKSCPLLGLFLKDNFQAMCKFEKNKPVYNWEDCAGPVNYYNCFNQFYVLYAGHQLSNLQERIYEGVQLNCNNSLILNQTEAVKSVSLFTIKADKQGRYVPDAVHELASGANDLKTILGEDLCCDTNNRNALTLKVKYKDGREVSHSLIHLETAYSQFAVVPDKQAHNISNAYGVRIISELLKPEKSYNSYTGTSCQVTLKCENSQDTTKPGALCLYIT